MKVLVLFLEIMFFLAVVGLIASTLGVEALQEWKITLIIIAGSLFIITTILRRKKKGATQNL
ncbi:hypothetical protein HPB58_09975 [Priestia filamentosa]|uniref:hypothetical protein n=1 Tax=Priestia filamentosa TaxID=1402861 RepID=UPI001FB27A85|nr:hypothetical protein [Priestia filamentosa]UOE62474.1 hypothetical protein HPB58_09975 [Priestia filamentosa]